MRFIIALAVGLVVLLTTLPIVSCAPRSETRPEVAPSPIVPTGSPVELNIIGVLPKDAIRAILEPEFFTAAQGMELLSSEEPVLGVSIGGDHRAYPLGLLNRHEIVNDVVGGIPLAVTW